MAPEDQPARTRSGLAGRLRGGLRRAGEGAEDGSAPETVDWAQLFSPADAPPTRARTVTILAPFPAAPDPDAASDAQGWVAEVVDGIAGVDGARVRVCTDAAGAGNEIGVPDRTALLTCLDIPSRRSEVYRDSSVVVLARGATGTAEGATGVAFRDADAAMLSREAAAAGCAVVVLDHRQPGAGRADDLPYAFVERDAAAAARRARLLAANQLLAERAGLAGSIAVHARAASPDYLARRGSAAAATVDPGRRRPQLSAVIATRRPHLVAAAVRTMAAQQEVDLQVLVVGHGFAPKLPTSAELDGLGGIAELRALEVPSDLLLGAVLNRGFAAADGALIAKVDDDDLYGPWYLAEQAAASRYTGAELVGKWTWYLHFAGLDVTVLRREGFEHRTFPHVSGATMLWQRDAAAAAPFPDKPRGVDIGAVARATQLGMAIYSTSRFNFIAVRHGEAHGHTWRAPDLAVATRDTTDRVHFFGCPSDQVLLPAPGQSG